MLKDPAHADPGRATLPREIHDRLHAAIEGGTLDLPLLPQVAQRVMADTADENCDVRRLAEAIKNDQAMAGNLLRIANSPLYGSPVRIMSLQQAINRLGISAVRQIALLVSTQTRAFRVDGHERKVKAQFRHSLAAACFAQEIARMKRWNVEEAFLSGLFHDVGRPVLLQAILDIEKELRCELDQAAIEATIEEYHARVGSMLAESWSFPKRVGQIILHHHHPEEAQSHRQFTMVTHLSDVFSHHLLETRRVDEVACRQHPALAALNLYPQEVEQLLALRANILDVVRNVE